MRLRYSNKLIILLIPVIALLLACACTDGAADGTPAFPGRSADASGAVIITPLPYSAETSDPSTFDPAAAEGSGAATPGITDGQGGEATPVNTAPVSPATLPVDPELLYSRSVILKDIDTGEILYSLSPDKRIFPASLTKIMTGLITAELLPSDRKYEITQEAIDFADSRGASTAGFNAGEITDKDAVLGGILMSSGAECSYTAAVNIAGSEADFAVLMNRRAQELGMSGTNFVNSTGLHDDNHYTTVSDLLILTEAALKNPDFVRFFKLDTFKAYTEPERKYQLTLVSTVFSGLAEYDFGKVKVIGGKTGYTRQAGLCLVTYAEYNGHRYVLVTAENEGNKNTEKYHFIDAAYVYRVLQEEIR